MAGFLRVSSIRKKICPVSNQPVVRATVRCFLNLLPSSKLSHRAHHICTSLDACAKPCDGILVQIHTRLSSSSMLFRILTRCVSHRLGLKWFAFHRIACFALHVFGLLPSVVAYATHESARVQHVFASAAMPGCAVQGLPSVLR